MNITEELFESHFENDCDEIFDAKVDIINYGIKCIEYQQTISYSKEQVKDLLNLAFEPMSDWKNDGLITFQLEQKINEFMLNNLK